MVDIQICIFPPEQFKDLVGIEAKSIKIVFPENNTEGNWPAMATQVNVK